MFIVNDNKIIGIKVLTYKNIIFDEWTEDEYGIWAKMCKHCLDKYKDRIDLEIDSVGVGACSIRGCDVYGVNNNIEITFIDFDINEVEFGEVTLEEWIVTLEKLKITLDDVLEELELRDGVIQRFKQGNNLLELYTKEELEVLAEEWNNHSIIGNKDNISFFVAKNDKCGVREFEFVVTRDFLNEFLDGEQTVEEFLEDYTSDDSISLFMMAALEGKLISTSGDYWFYDDDDE